MCALGPPSRSQDQTSIDHPLDSAYLFDAGRLRVITRPASIYQGLGGDDLELARGWLMAELMYPNPDFRISWFRRPEWMLLPVSNTIGLAVQLRWQY